MPSVSVRSEELLVLLGRHPAAVRVTEPSKPGARSTGKPNPDRGVECFRRYMDHDGAAVSRTEFEANLAAKLANDVFLEDLRLPVPPEIDCDPVKAARVIRERLIAKRPGEPWKGAPEQ